MSEESSKRGRPCIKTKNGKPVRRKVFTFSLDPSAVQIMRDAADKAGYKSLSLYIEDTLINTIQGDNHAE